MDYANMDNGVLTARMNDAVLNDLNSDLNQDSPVHASTYLRQRKQTVRTDEGQDDPEPKHESEQDKRDVKICRICLDGVEEEPSLGRLISPCKCKGTMKYVHVECLNTWRKVSQKKTSFFKCDECKYNYSFNRTKLAKIFSSSLVLTLATFMIFFISVFLGGFLAKIFLFLFDVSPNSSSPLYAITQQPFHITLLRIFTPIYYDAGHDDDYVVNEVEEDLSDLLQTENPSQESKVSIVKSVLTIDMAHFLAGFSLVGMIGIIQIVLSSLLFPFHSPSWWGRGLRIRTVGTGSGRQGGYDGASSLFWVVFITIGTIRAMWSIYKAVSGIARRMLESVELMILEVDE